MMYDVATRDVIHCVVCRGTGGQAVGWPGRRAASSDDSSIRGDRECTGRIDLPEADVDAPWSCHSSRGLRAAGPPRPRRTRHAHARAIDGARPFHGDTLSDGAGRYQGRDANAIFFSRRQHSRHRDVSFRGRQSGDRYSWAGRPDHANRGHLDHHRNASGHLDHHGNAHDDRHPNGHGNRDTDLNANIDGHAHGKAATNDRI